MPRVEVPANLPFYDKRTQRKDERTGNSRRQVLDADLLTTASCWGGSRHHEEGRTLYGLAILSTAIDELIAREVAEWRADSEPMSWSTIGAALGISRQAAQQRFGVKPD